ncbi:SAM-dependent methyltransferase [Basilea psittacipulmonis]|uniref:site-specific DNA-methyltransferase (adenine-specific) n=1 Tax=Basilea psittacipulmonis DSM 24701 TaxID=1072685 RepID=A0A077DGM1_9BURK|nr:SAM-dependent methyltransferase [Basilea psittacipulmonis]AIL32283.1 SAM-dependent methlyltransferase [Basilea psittacipulmonis DSM 24701]
MKTGILNKKEFGDFQTPYYFALQVCEKLKTMGIEADSIIEPTCGIGAFVLASRKTFPTAKIFASDINPSYLKQLINSLSNTDTHYISTQSADFFSMNWNDKMAGTNGRLLILGNLPWVTNTALGKLGSQNLPQKNNFLKFKGLDALTGKANFDISESMLTQILSALDHKKATIAMLVKTAVARKIIAFSKENKIPIVQASLFKINAKKIFNAHVDACLMVIAVDPTRTASYDYFIYDGIDDFDYTKTGYRDGLNISNLDDYQQFKNLLGVSHIKWRSGIKHDLSAVMELTRDVNGYINGLNEPVDIEAELLYPLMKGSDVGSNKAWRNKFVIVTQKNTGMDTSYIKDKYPKAWKYLLSHSEKLDARASRIYKNNSRFSIFGVGDYSFKNWKIAICSLYKDLSFRLVHPIEEKPVQFDDTVYFLSFDSQEEAEKAYAYLTSDAVKKILNSLIFWDDKRPIKTSILNLLKWEHVAQKPTHL